MTISVPDSNSIPQNSLLAAGQAAAIPIPRRSLHDELLERIRQLIVDGEIPPGTKVPERQLCEHYNVSRTPLREALKVLAAEGLVTLTPNRGSMVTNLTLQDLEEMFPVMAALEALSGELACGKITDAGTAAIREMHERMRSEYQARNLNAYFRLNRQIHEGILAAAGNSLLASHYHNVSHRIRRARLAANVSRERWERAMAEHEDIIAALEARNGELLSAILKQHIMNLLYHYREVLRRSPAPQ